VADLALVDTNVLAGAVDLDRPSHPACMRRMQQGGLRVCAQVAREFLAVATRSKVANGLGLDVVSALDVLNALLVHAPLLPESVPLLPTQLMLIRETGAQGRSIHDAGVVAAAVAHAIPVVVSTDAQIFARFARWVRVIAP